MHFTHVTSFLTQHWKNEATAGSEAPIFSHVFGEQIHKVNKTYLSCCSFKSVNIITHSFMMDCLKCFLSLQRWSCDVFESDIRDLQCLTHQRTQLSQSVREGLLISRLEFSRNKSNSLCWRDSHPIIHPMLLTQSVCTTLTLSDPTLPTITSPPQPPQRSSSLSTWETGRWRCEWRRASR